MEYSEYVESERKWLAEVYQGDKVDEFSLKAVLGGCFLGVFLVASNVYMGLKTGWGQGGSIIAAIVGFAIFKMLRQELGILENNILQTIGSAAGSIGNVVNVVPALILLGIELTPVQLFAWLFGTSFLGIFFAIPLKKQIINIEKLTFPTGTAAAVTIKALYSKGDQAVQKAKVLAGVGAFSAITTFLRDMGKDKLGFLSPLAIPSNSYLPFSIKGYACKKLTLGVNWSAMMFGAGLMIGPRVGVSLLVGSIATWAFIAPWIASAGIIDKLGYKDVVNWSMWAGTALMVSHGLTAMAFNWRVILRALKSLGSKGDGSEEELPTAHLEVSFKLWLGGSILASIMVLGMLKVVFDVAIWLGVIAIILSFLLATIAVRATGETDINPVGAMGHITQGLYGALAPGAVGANLVTAGVTASGASEASDMMQDLKTGYLLGATPRRQFWAQIIGVTVGALAAVPVFLLMTSAYKIGTPELPAPAAVVWKSLAEVVAKGVSALPQYSLEAGAIGLVLGALMAVMEKSERFKKYSLSATGVGIAMVVPGYYCISMFLGSMARLYYDRTYGTEAEGHVAPIASGTIAGEGVMGVCVAAIVLYLGSAQ